MDFTKRISTPLDLALWRTAMIEQVKEYPRDRVPLEVSKQVAEAKLIWFSGEMFDLAWETSETLGGIHKFEILDYLPSTSGIICFDGGKEVSDNNRKMGRLDGILWRVDHTGLLYVDMFVDIEYYIHVSKPATRSDISDMQLRKKFKDAPVLVNALVHATGQIVNGVLEAKDQISPVLLACLLLMREGGVSHVNQMRVSRPPLNRKERSFKDVVNVINVGNIKHVESSEHNGSKLSVRFIVGGHFRNQWYAREQVNKRIFINPYIKGPAGAPMRQSRPVYKF